MTPNIENPIDIIANDFSDLANALLNDLEKVLDAFPDSSLNTLSNGLTNNPFSIIYHLLGSARYWIGEVVGNIPSQRVRSEEFGRTGNKTELMERLTDTRQHIKQTFDTLGDHDLERREINLSRGVLSWGSLGVEGRSSVWVLAHDLCHIAYHLGQLKLLLLSEISEQKQN